MSKIILADASCLIAFDNINSLPVLYETFGVVSITSEIAMEFGKPLPFQSPVVSCQDLKFLNDLKTKLGAGEASAIAFAVEQPDTLLILDDDKARKTAASFQLNYTGTLGVLLLAKEKKVIPNVKPYLGFLQAAGMRLSRNLEEAILKLCGE